MSITALMDECCLIAEYSDLTLLEKMNDNFATHGHFETYKTTQDRKIANNAFRIKHYAGDVTYNIEGFLEKNKDTLFSDLGICMHGSQNKVLTELFPPVDLSNKKRPLTASAHFKVLTIFFKIFSINFFFTKRML